MELDIFYQHYQPNLISLEPSYRYAGIQVPVQVEVKVNCFLNLLVLVRQNAFSLVIVNIKHASFEKNTYKNEVGTF